MLGAHAGGHQLGAVDAEVVDQMLAHGLGALLRQREVVVGAALGVGVAGDEEFVAGQPASLKARPSGVSAAAAFGVISADL